MKTLFEIQNTLLLIAKWKQKGLTIALVPTMGSLHQGHLSLVRLAKQKADKVIVSIFVNPMQFGKNEDFNKYPRTIDSDCKKLQELFTDLVFIPEQSEIYPNLGNNLGNSQTEVVANNILTNHLEGQYRNGHFTGVTTIIAKLFNILQPNIAIFGKKDYQQLMIIKQMTVDLSFDIEILGGETVRDKDGLALSSRNQYLTVSQKEIAPKLQQILLKTKQNIINNNTDLTKLCTQASQQLSQIGFDKVDYFTIIDSNSLQPIKKLTSNQKISDLVIIAAARLGETRLLDNITSL